MYSQRSFVFEQSEDTGLIGLRPLWLHRADPTNSVAHDVLEHFSANPQLSATEDELLALGAVLAVRVENGLFHTHFSYEHHMGNLVYTVLSDMDIHADPFPRVMHSPELGSDFVYAEDILQASLPLAASLMRQEDDQRFAELLQECPDLLERTARWIRAGYARTWERFQDVDLYWLGGSFYQQIDKVSKSLVGGEALQYGDKVQFCTNPQEQHLSVRINGKPLSLQELTLH